MPTDQKTLTLDSGIPVESDEVSKTAGKQGPILLEDYYLLEKNAQFNRERIPERVVHALGSGAYGELSITGDISDLTCAKVLQKGTKTKAFVRFSTVARSKGGGDIYRDLRGFAMKFYTEDGNWDLVGNNTPIFFVRDPKKFIDFIRTQKEHPRLHSRESRMWWDFWSRSPESLHQVLWLMGDRGAPMGWRHMNGYGSHTYSLYTADGKRTWVKFHFRSDQGRKFFTDDQWKDLEGKEPRWAQKDLYTAIENGNFPSWTFSIQTMTDEQAKAFKWDPFDITKVWPHKDFPLREVGKLTLNKNPDNYFQDVEQAAFSPGEVVPGISWSPDRMLQARIFAYSDAHRHRLSVNYHQIPVNRPIVETNTSHHDGLMRVDGNHGSRINYHPTREEYPKAAGPSVAPPPMKVEGDTALVANDYEDWADQAKMYLDILDGGEMDRLVSNIVGALGPCEQDVIDRQLTLFAAADAAFAARVKKALADTPPEKLPFEPGAE